MSITKPASIAVSLSLLAACGGPARPRLVAIEQSHRSEAGQSNERWQLDYRDGGRLRDVALHTDGVATGTWSFDYDGDRVVDVAVSEIGSGVTHTLRFDYDGGRLRRSTRELREPTGEVERRVTDYAYQAERLRLSQWMETVTAVSDELLGVHVGQSELDYDDHGRLARARHETDGEGATDELRYAVDGNLEAVVESIDGSEAEVHFTYDDHDRVLTVSEPGGVRHVVTYGEDGTIDRVDTSLGGLASRTTRYVYGDGAVDGLVPTPQFAWGELFDLEGRRLDRWQPLTSDLLAL